MKIFYKCDVTSACRTPAEIPVSAVQVSLAYLPKLDEATGAKTWWLSDVPVNRAAGLDEEHLIDFKFAKCFSHVNIAATGRKNIIFNCLWM